MKVKIPLTRRRVVGIACDRAEITLRVQTRYGDFVAIPFIVDTGADLSAIPVSLAAREGISFDRGTEGQARGLVGTTRKYRDVVRLVIGNREHQWPCDFVETPPSAGSERLYGVLGRAGFLDEYDIRVARGILTISRPAPILRWWEGVWDQTWARVSPLRASNDPL